MECPQCEWESLPGTKACPVCGHDFDKESGGRTYPPRAVPHRWNGILSRLFRLMGRRSDSEKLESKRFELSAPVQLETMLITCLGFFPGLGHLVLGKMRLAAIFAGAFLALVIMTAISWRSPISNITAVLAISFPLFSAAHAGALASRKRATRKDFGALVMLPILVVLVIAWWLISSNFQFMEARARDFEPIVARGECVVVRNEHLSVEELRRGAVILFRGAGEAFSGTPNPMARVASGFHLGRIVGLPGERLITRGGRLLIDNTLDCPYEITRDGALVPDELHPRWRPHFDIDVILEADECFVILGQVACKTRVNNVRGKPIGVILPAQSRRFIVD